MKKLLLTLVMLAGFVSTASAVTLYKDGVTTSDGLTLAALNGQGWTTQYNEFYSAVNTQAQIAGWKAAAGSKNVFVGATDLQGNIIVGATGLASQVLSLGGTSSTAIKYSSSNLYWYNVSSQSFGFTPTESIILDAADISGTGLIGGTPDDGMNDLRLSWHTTEGHGGWRAGATTSLNFSTTHKKIVLFGDGPRGVPDSGSTAALIGLALLGLAAIRRKLG